MEINLKHENKMKRLLTSLLFATMCVVAHAQKTDAQLLTESATEIGGKTYAPSRAQAMFDDVIKNKINYADLITTVGTNTYTPSATFGYFTSLPTGLSIRVKIGTSNTGASTLNINSIGAVPIVKSGNVPLVAGDLVAGRIYNFIYDGTNFQITGGLLTAPGSDSNVIINQSGALGASSQFKYEVSPNRLTIGTGQTNTQGTDNFLVGLNSTIGAGSWQWVFGEENSINLLSGSKGFGDNGILSGYQNQINNTIANPFVGSFETTIVGGYDNVSNDATQAYALGGSHNRLTLCRSCGVAGEWGEAQGYGAFAHGLQDQAGHAITPAPTQRVLASGLASFNWSVNNNWQTVGYGTTAERSSNLNTKNGNVACVGCVSLGGYNINLTSSYDSGTVAVSHLAIMQKPTIADTTGFFIGYRSSDGKAVRIHRSSLTTSLSNGQATTFNSGTNAIDLGGLYTTKRTIYGTADFQIGQSPTLGIGKFQVYTRGDVNFQNQSHSGSVASSISIVNDSTSGSEQSSFTFSSTATNSGNSYNFQIGGAALAGPSAGTPDATGNIGVTGPTGGGASINFGLQAGEFSISDSRVSPATGLQNASDYYNVGGQTDRSIIDLGTMNRRPVKRMAKAATTANITLSGTQTIDGVALSANDICLVKNQTTGSQNGLYVVKSTAWIRVDEFDGTTDYSQGALFSVRQGTLNAQTMWICTNTGSITFGTTSITFALFNNPMTTVGDIIQGSTNGVATRLAAVATGNVFLSGGVATANSWGKVGLTTHVSGTLPVANGGLGITTTPSNGQIPIGNGTTYTAATLTAGSGISITNGSGSITVTNTKLYYNGSFSQVGAATTTFTVTIGTTQANTTYNVQVTPTDALAAALFYVTNKTTTTFDVVYLTGLTGTVNFDWIVTP